MATVMSGVNQTPLERADDELPQVSGRADVIHRPHPQRPPDVVNTVELGGHLPERLGRTTRMVSASS